MFFYPDGLFFLKVYQWYVSVYHRLWFTVHCTEISSVPQSQGATPIMISVIWGHRAPFVADPPLRDAISDYFNRCLLESNQGRGSIQSFSSLPPIRAAQIQGLGISKVIFHYLGGCIKTFVSVEWHLIHKVWCISPWKVVWLSHIIYWLYDYLPGGRLMQWHW